MEVLREGQEFTESNKCGCDTDCSKDQPCLCMGDYGC